MSTEAGTETIHVHLAQAPVDFELSGPALGIIQESWGSHLSAGERQLVSLARAALTDPAVLIMDEATSSIDPGTEHQAKESLAALAAGRTVVVVAHRLTAAERADGVAVVRDGELVEIGSHDELIEADGHYARLFAAWSGGELND